MHEDATESTFTFGDTNGWVASASEDGEGSRLELQGDACETLKRGKGELLVDCPCGVIIPVAE